MGCKFYLFFLSGIVNSACLVGEIVNFTCIFWWDCKWYLFFKKCVYLQSHQKKVKFTIPPTKQAPFTIPQKKANTQFTIPPKKNKYNLRVPPNFARYSVHNLGVRPGSGTKKDHRSSVRPKVDQLNSLISCQKTVVKKSIFKKGVFQKN